MNAGIVHKTADETLAVSFHAAAADAEGMQRAQADVVSYLEQQIANLSAEKKEAEDAAEIATMAGYKADRLHGLVRRLAKRGRYLNSLLLAAREGYTIVPNMPCTLFAIRVARATPAQKAVRSTYSLGDAQRSVPDEEHQSLPAGDGQYQNPISLGRSSARELPAEAGKTPKVEHTWEPTAFDSIDFPLIAARPLVMKATQRAMALKVFDAIGIVQDSPALPGKDPLVLGIVELKDGSRVMKRVSFLVAWNVDLRQL